MPEDTSTSRIDRLRSDCNCIVVKGDEIDDGAYRSINDQATKIYDEETNEVIGYSVPGKVKDSNGNWQDTEIVYDADMPIYNQITRDINAPFTDDSSGFPSNVYSLSSNTELGAYSTSGVDWERGYAFSMTNEFSDLDILRNELRIAARRPAVVIVPDHYPDNTHYNINNPFFNDGSGFSISKHDLQAAKDTRTGKKDTITDQESTQIRRKMTTIRRKYSHFVDFQTNPWKYTGRGSYQVAVTPDDLKVDILKSIQETIKDGKLPAYFEDVWRWTSAGWNPLSKTTSLDSSSISLDSTGSRINDTHELVNLEFTDDMVKKFVIPQLDNYYSVSEITLDELVYSVALDRLYRLKEKIMEPFDFDILDNDGKRVNNLNSTTIQLPVNATYSQEVLVYKSSYESDGLLNFDILFDPSFTSVWLPWNGTYIEKPVTWDGLAWNPDLFFSSTEMFMSTGDKQSLIDNNGKLPRIDFDNAPSFIVNQFRSILYLNEIQMQVNSMFDISEAQLSHVISNLNEADFNYLTSYYSMMLWDDMFNYDKEIKLKYSGRNKYDTMQGEYWELVFDSTLRSQLSSWWIGDSIRGSQTLVQTMKWEAIDKNNEHLFHGIDSSNFIIKNDVARYLYSDKYTSSVTFNDLYEGDGMMRLVEVIQPVGELMVRLIRSPNAYTMPLDDDTANDPYMKVVNRAQLFFGVPRIYPEISDGNNLFSVFEADFREAYDRLNVRYVNAWNALIAMISKRNPKSELDGMNGVLDYSLSTIGRPTSDGIDQKYHAYLMGIYFL